MKQTLLFILSAAIFALADFCPDCDIAAYTTFKINPSIINSEEQTIQLTLTLDCPTDTRHKAFAGYTIDWGDNKVPTYRLYDEDVHQHDICKANQRIDCKNLNDPIYRRGLRALKTFTENYTYTEKKSYNIKIKLSAIESSYINSSSKCASSGSEVHIETRSISTSISSTPLSYCAIPKDYALFATKNLTINDRVSCSRDEISSATCTVGAENNITIGVKGTVDNAHSNEKLTLRNYSKVYSGVWAKEIEAQKGAEYTKKGSTTTFNYDSGISAISFASTSEFIESNKTKKYEPGVYGDVTVRRDGTLILNSDGVYIFKNIRFETGSTLKLQSTKTTELYAQEFNFSGTVTGAKASNFLVGVLGSSATYVDNGFTGSIWAPQSRMVIGQFHHKVYSGSYMAKELIVPQDTKIDYVQFVKNGGCK